MSHEQIYRLHVNFAELLDSLPAQLSIIPAVLYS